METKINSQLKNLSLVFLFVIISLLNINCKKSSYDSPTPSSSPGANEVWMQNMAFTPSSRTVSVNTTVTWTNKDSNAHTITSDNGSFTGSGDIASGNTFSFKFTTAGTYPYHCSIHPSMTANIIVQ